MIIEKIRGLLETTGCADTCPECGCLTSAGVNRCWECVEEGDFSDGGPP